MSYKSQGDGITLGDLKDYHNQKVAPFLSTGGDGSFFSIYTETLAAGNTTVTFDEIPTSGNYVVDFYTSTGINYTDIDTSTAGEVTLTFEEQESAITVYCKVTSTVSNTPTMEIKTANLAIGSTSVTFTGVPTSGNNLIELYTSVPGLEYVSVDNTTAGSLTYTFEAQESAVTVYLVIKEVS